MKNVPAVLNDNSKLIICIDISCKMLNITLDSQEAYKYSALRKTRYDKSLQTIMKLMNFNKELEIKDVALKMEIINPSIEKTAKKIIKAYAEQKTEVDLDHPQYNTMSVYQACKVENVKTNKKKFIAMSNLKPNQWAKLEKMFDEVRADIKPDQPNNNTNQKSSEIIEQASNESSKTLKRKIAPEVEDYESWKKRTLAKAYADLKVLKAVNIE